MSKPIHKIKDSLLTANIWANQAENGIFYSVTFERSYKNGDEWKSTASFSGGDILKIAFLAQRAYGHIAKLREGDEQ